MREPLSCPECDDLPNSECDVCWGQRLICGVCEMPWTECECVEEESTEQKEEG